MLSTLLSSRASRITACFLIASLCWFPVAPRISAAETSGSEDALTVAVAGLENRTGRAILPDDYGVESLIAAAARVENIEIVPAEKVLDLLEEEPDLETALSVGEALGADMALFGAVTSVEFMNGREAIVSVELYLYSVGGEEVLISRSVVKASSGEKPGWQGDLGMLAVEALRNALDDAVNDLFGNLSKYGLVTVSKGNVVYTNLGTRIGVNYGARLAVIQDYEQIATLQADETGVSHSKTTVLDLKPGKSIRDGDKVRVIYSPRPRKPEEVEKIERTKRKKKLSPIVVGVLAIGVIAALTRGKGKAEKAPAQQVVTLSKSADGNALIYSPNGFNQDYMPNPPAATTINDSDLKYCNNANCTENICSICTSLGSCQQDTTAYEFSLASKPKNPEFPSPWTIAISTEGISLGSTSTSKIKLATCNESTGQWEIVQGSYYGNITQLNEKGVQGQVTHFTPYVAVIDNRPAPIATPSLTAAPGDKEIVLSWYKSSDTDANGYRIYTCSASSCDSILLEITDLNTITQTFSNLVNGQAYCYALQVTSTGGNRDSDLSTITCATPTTEPSGITLVSPASGTSLTSSTPTFIFIGNGASNYYLLNVTDGTGVVVFSSTTNGEVQEGSSPPDPVVRKTYSSTYGGQALVTDSTYYWKVKGINTASPSAADESQTWSFVFKGTAVDPGECDPNVVPDPPTLITPNNGAQIVSSTPMFQWTDVPNATKYTISVYNSEGTVVYQKEETSPTSTYAGDTLKNNIQYSWNVRSLTDCAYSLESSSFFFTKKSTSETPLPAPEWVNLAEDGKEPITGGDQYVVLNWRPVNDPDLAGYTIYRCETVGVCSTQIDGVFKEQLDASPPNINCPTFSETNPGYCDVSVTNGKRYYYQVRAFDDAQQESDPSVTQSILLPLQRPQLIGPGGVVAASVTTSTPTFTWMEVNGADISYVLTVTDTSTSVIVWQTTVTSNVVKYDGVALVNEKTYSWKVKAFNEATQSEDSQLFYFTKKPETTRPSAPNWCDGVSYCIGFPTPYVNNYQSNSITVYWEKSSATNIAAYNIYRAGSPAGLPGPQTVDTATPYAIVSNYDCPTLANIVCFEDLDVNRSEYYYYVVTAVDSGGTESIPSSVLGVTDFNLKGATLVYPYDQQNVYEPKPTFQWVAEPGATSYRIELEEISPGNFAPTDLIWVATTSGTSITYGDVAVPKEPLKNPTSPTSEKKYHWRVCSINTRAPLGKCEGSVFRFSKRLKQPDQTSMSPHDLYLSDADPVFTWTKSIGAAGYQIRLCEGSGGTCSTGQTLMFNGDVGDVSSIKLSGMDSTLVLQNCDTTVSPPDCNNAGAYSWQIRAYDEYGAVSYNWENITGAYFFKVPVAAPVLVQPANLAIINPDPSCGTGVDMYGNFTYNYELTFSWGGVYGAGSYIIKVEEEIEAPPAGQYVSVWQTEVSGLTTKNVNINCTAFGSTPDPTGVILFSPGRKYRWNVTASDAPFDDNNARYFITGLPAPNLVEPIDGKEVIMVTDCDGLGAELCVHFTWDQVYGASSYDVEIKRRSDGTFAKCKPLDTSNVTVTVCDLAEPAVTNGESYTWRIRARDSITDIDPNGDAGPWSSMRSFTVFIPAPVLASPPNSNCNSTGTFDDVITTCTLVACQDLAFYWSPIPLSATKIYKLQVSDTVDFRNLLREDDSSSSPAMFPCPDNTCYQASSGDPILLVNGVEYYWRVGASIDGSSWIYSAPFEFYKRPPPPTALTTANLTYNSVELQWQPPVNCDGTSPASSIPIVPNDPAATMAGYLIYQESAMPDTFPTNLIATAGPNATNFVVTNLNEQTDYFFCVVTLDNSGFITGFAGSLSSPSCVFVHTPAQPTP
ncbi:MAG: fibronectin type III domain-containing protein [bacterium]